MNDWLEYKIILDNKILIKNLENSLIINKNYNNRIKKNGLTQKKNTS